MRLPSCLAAVLWSAVPWPAWSHGEEPIRVGRYSTLAAAPRPARVDPLAAVASVSFPASVTTVGAALRHLLDRSGYRLAAPEASHPTMPVLLGYPLPEVHRHPGPMALQHALTTLAGSAWCLVVDPVHRLISFEPSARYRGISPVTPVARSTTTKASSPTGSEK